MMRSTVICLIVSLQILIGPIISAQNGLNEMMRNRDYSTKNKKAIEAFEQGYMAYSLYEFPLAEKMLLEAISKDNEFYEAIILLCYTYEDMKEHEKAAVTMERAIEVLGKKAMPRLYFTLAKNYMLYGAYSGAKRSLEKFINSKDIDFALKGNAENLLRKCEFAILQKRSPVPFDPKKMSSTINTPYDEYFPSITIDQRTMIFTRRIPIDNDRPYVLTNSQEDFFFSQYDGIQWSQANNIGQIINTPGNEGAQCISADGKDLFFTACHREDGKGSCDLYHAKKIGDSWSKPTNMGEIINTPDWETQPSFSSDGKTLYFVSTRKGGRGGMDIWKTVRNENGTWSIPKNLGDSINTIQNEGDPFIHPDDKTLYFSSTGHIGMGKSDIFISRKKEDGSWGKARNLGYPINTYEDELGFFVSADGKTAYFSSSRGNPDENLDIFYFELYKEARPEKISYLKGTVYDKETEKKLLAEFELINLQNGKTVVQSKSDPVTGEFLVSLPLSNDYALNVSRSGYLFYSENFSIPDSAKNDLKPFHKDVPLQPIKEGEKLILRNVFFDHDKYELKPASKIELDKLVALLTSNPQMQIEIGGHTDNTGNSTYNQTLSNQRAGSVHDYLVSQGIEPERLSYKGYGEDEPIDTNNTEDGRANNRRTEIKIMKK